MEKFILVLKNDKTLQYDRMAYFIILLNFILFVYLGIFSSEKESVKIASALGAALIAICILLNYFLRKIRHNQGSPYIHGGLIIIVMTWLQIGNYWFMIL
ncbi:MAG TPA: hypothetical protein VFO70_07460, partial [Chitinophagaceae bacterium]|nr:hypothetical protein [Chitinophagaceae bacterium]